MKVLSIFSSTISNASSKTCNTTVEIVPSIYKTNKKDYCYLCFVTLIFVMPTYTIQAIITR